MGLLETVLPSSSRGCIALAHSVLFHVLVLCFQDLPVPLMHWVVWAVAHLDVAVPDLCCFLVVLVLGFRFALFVLVGRAPFGCLFFLDTLALMLSGSCFG